MSEHTSYFEKLGRWIKNSITFKIVSIGILILLLMIPTSMIENIIWERKERQEVAVSEISSKWGDSQTLSGPIISVPYLTYYKTKDDEVKSIRKNAHFLPQLLDVSGNIQPEVRYRGIYEAVVYTADLKFTGKFSAPSFDEWKVNPGDVLWEEAMLSLGVPDMRGINEQIFVDWNDDRIEFMPGLPSNDVLETGVSGRVKLRDSTNVEAQFYDFSFDISINGSSNLSFLPVGAETNVVLTSEWKNPSFNGRFLPDNREVGENGFESEWKVLQLNREYPQQWVGDIYNPLPSQFGVELKIGVDQYQKNMRTAKYAILIISLTFMLFFFMEVVNKNRIHPIQYLLVGFALSIFYALLLSISEHSSFGLAYIASALAVIMLVLVYVQGVLKSRKLSLFLGGALVIIYGFIFIILQLQDFAMLVGSIGLFVVLCIIMYSTRNIDWYSINKVSEEKEKE